MTDQINKRLAEAYAAQAQLAPQAELQAIADEIPQLLHEKAILDHQAQVKATLDAATSEASAEFAIIAERMPVLRDRLQTMLDDIRVLAKDIQVEENNIANAGQRLLSAQVNYDEVFGTRSGKLTGTGNDAPAAFSLLASFDAALERAGAGNSALNLTPDGLPDWALVLLRSQKVGVIYNPARKAANWSVMR